MLGVLTGARVCWGPSTGDEPLSGAAVQGPIVWFVQDVFHPSVGADGLIHLDVLSGGRWPSEWPEDATIAFVSRHAAPSLISAAHQL